MTNKIMALRRLMEKRADANLLGDIGIMHQPHLKALRCG